MNEERVNNYLETLNPTLKEYFHILSDEFPLFLIDYMETPRMQKQANISVSCGTNYSKMFSTEMWYSSLDHSVAVALIIWHFTHDKKQTLAGLFHDISTPAFKHCIDFMNHDYEKQESTEDLTKTMILNSEEIMELLRRDNILIDEIADYHQYPIADNDTPMLSADRLEYTLSNALGEIEKIWGLEDIKRIYSDIKIVRKEDGTPEMCFDHLTIAEQFVAVMSHLSVCYMDDKRRFSMQFLADIMRKMSEKNIISISDLYELSEEKVIQKIEQCKEDQIADCFQIWKNGSGVMVSEKCIPNQYCVNVRVKKRYINPLVKTENDIKRITDLSANAKENIDKCLNYTFDRYLSMGFMLK